MNSRYRILSDLELAEALRPTRLRLPELPRVIEIRFEEIPESSSEESGDEGGLELFVIVADDTPAEHLDWRHVEPIERTIRDTLHASGEARWPYFQFGTRADYREWKTPIDVEDEAA